MQLAVARPNPFATARLGDLHNSLHDALSCVTYLRALTCYTPLRPWYGLKTSFVTIFSNDTSLGTNFCYTCGMTDIFTCDISCLIHM